MAQRLSQLTFPPRRRALVLHAVQAAVPHAHHDGYHGRAAPVGFQATKRMHSSAARRGDRHRRSRCAPGVSRAQAPSASPGITLRGGSAVKSAGGKGGCGAVYRPLRSSPTTRARALLRLDYYFPWWIRRIILLFVRRHKKDWNEVRPSMAKHGPVWPSMAKHGQVWPRVGNVWPSVAECGHGQGGPGQCVARHQGRVVTGCDCTQLAQPAQRQHSSAWLCQVLRLSDYATMDYIE
jgi:hypothetical protein